MGWDFILGLFLDLFWKPTFVEFIFSFTYFVALTFLASACLLFYSLLSFQALVKLLQCVEGLLVRALVGN